MVGGTVVGEPAQMTVLRGGKEIALDVVIAELAEDREVGPARTTAPRADERLGMSIAPLTDEQRSQTGVEAGGVLITGVDPNGVAALAGIQTGDVLMSFNQKPVESTAQLRELVAAAPAGKPIAALINRDSNPLFTALTLE